MTTIAWDGTHLAVDRCRTITNKSSSVRRALIESKIQSFIGLDVTIDNSPVTWCTAAGSVEDIKYLTLFIAKLKGDLKEWLTKNLTQQIVVPKCSVVLLTADGRCYYLKIRNDSKNKTVFSLVNEKPGIIAGSGIKSREFIKSFSNSALSITSSDMIYLASQVDDSTSSEFTIVRASSTSIKSVKTIGVRRKKQLQKAIMATYFKDI